MHMDLHRISDYALLIIVVAIYVISVLASARIFWPETGVQLLWVNVSQNIVLTGYIFYTLLLGFVAKSHHKLRRKQIDEAERLVAEETSEEPDTSAEEPKSSEE